MKMVRFVCYAAAVFSSLSILDGANATSNSTCTGINAISPSCKSNESLYYRDFFYVGGRYVDSVLGNLTYDQIYVEKLSPAGGVTQPKPIIFFHGGGTSGVVSLTYLFNPFVLGHIAPWPRHFLIHILV